MQARKQESHKKKYENLPRDFCNLAEGSILEAFEGKLEHFDLVVSGRLYPEEIIVRLSLSEGDELKNHNFSVSVDHSIEKANALAQMHLAMDLLAGFLEQFLEAESAGEELELPLDWHTYEVEGQEIALIYDTENDELEAMANELLGPDADAALDLSDEELGEEFFNQKPDPDEIH